MQSSPAKINLRDHGTQVLCESCGSQTFREAVYIFKVSKIMTGEAQDSIVPVPTFQCSSCGHVNEEFSIPPKTESSKSIIA